MEVRAGGRGDPETEREERESVGERNRRLRETDRRPRWKGRETGMKREDGRKG